MTENIFKNDEFAMCNFVAGNMADKNLHKALTLHLIISCCFESMLMMTLKYYYI